MTCLIKGCNFVLKNIPHEAFVYQKDSHPEFRFSDEPPQHLPISPGQHRLRGLYREGLAWLVGRRGFHSGVSSPGCVSELCWAQGHGHTWGWLSVFMGHRQSAGHWLAVGEVAALLPPRAPAKHPETWPPRGCHLQGIPESPRPLASGPAGQWLGACLLTLLPLFCTRWRRRTGSRIGGSSIGAAPSGGLGLCSPRRRYFCYWVGCFWLQFLRRGLKAVVLGPVLGEGCVQVALSLASSCY